MSSTTPMPASQPNDSKRSRRAQKPKTTKTDGSKMNVTKTVGSHETPKVSQAEPKSNKTDTQPTDAIKSKKVVLTPAQHAKLKTGKKVSVSVGCKGDSFIGIEGAYVNLLTQYWGFAKQRLSDGSVSILFIEDGLKPTVQWIYAYMLAGEKDVDCHVKLDSLTITQLVDLYDHATYLEYTALQYRAFGTLRYQLRNTFPDIAEIQKVHIAVPELDDFVLKLIVDRFIQPLIFDYTPYTEYALHDTAFGNSLDSSVREALDRLIARSVKYYNRPHNPRRLQQSKHTSNPPNRGRVESRQISSNLDQDKKTTQSHGNGKPVVKLPSVTDSKRAQTAPVQSHQSPAKSKRSRVQKRGPKREKTEADVHTPEKSVAKESAGSKSARTEKPRAVKTCFRCNYQGHIARECNAILSRADSAMGSVSGNTSMSKQPTNATRETMKLTARVAPTCYNCNEQGHIARYCTTTMTARRPPTCYNCNEQGHISRKCPHPREIPNSAGSSKEANAPRLDAGRGRNMNRRRAQMDQYYNYAREIELAADGEGVQTCVRVVRAGEYTRTGLKI